MNVTFPLRPAKAEDLKYLFVHKDGSKEWRVHYGLMFFWKTDKNEVTGPHYLLKEIYQDHLKIKELLDSGQMLLISEKGKITNNKFLTQKV